MRRPKGWLLSRLPAAPLAAAALFFLRAHGAIAHVPAWALGVPLAVGGVFSFGADMLWPDGGSGLWMHVRIAAEASIVTAIIYATGWGPTLSIGYLFNAVVVIRAAGGRAERPTIFWSLAGIVAGQTAISRHIAPTFIRQPEVHGLAFLAASGTAYVIHLIGQNSRERERGQAVIARSEQRFRSLVQNASDIIVVVNAHGEVEYVSPSVEAVLGYTPMQYTHNLGMDFLHPDDVQKGAEVFARVVKTPGNSASVQVRVVHANGSWRTVEVRVQNLLDDPSVRGIVANVADITERKVAEERLAYQAYNDILTRLPNRMALNDRLARAVSRASRHNTALALLFLDLDGFKRINDRLGHEIGDELLVQAAERLAACVRPEDTIARLGGDEFTAILEDLRDASDAARAAERMITALQTPFKVRGSELFVSASIGIVISRGGDPPSELLRNADLAMYLAKENGRNRWEMFDAATAQRVVDRLELETDLRAALDNQELTVYYQPQIELRTGNILGFEALARWAHPRRGLVGAGDFIPLAEDIGAVVPIGQHVLRRACSEIAAWRWNGAPLFVAVNISPLWLRDPDFVPRVADAISASGLSASNVQLEITEDVAVVNESCAVASLSELKELGVVIAIDDFGTGYSSLSYLTRFPIDIVKLDRTFISAIAHGAKDRLAVEAVVGLAHSLGMRVVAEGVEEGDQVAALQDAGCDLAQGFYFSPPLPAVEAKRAFAAELPAPPRAAVI